MTQQLLHVTQGCALLKQVGGKAVPQGVGCYLAFNPRPLAVSLEEIPDPLPGQPARPGGLRTGPLRPCCGPAATFCWWKDSPAGRSGPCRGRILCAPWTLAPKADIGSSKSMSWTLSDTSSLTRKPVAYSSSRMLASAALRRSRTCPPPGATGPLPPRRDTWEGSGLPGRAKGFGWRFFDDAVLGQESEKGFYCCYLSRCGRVPIALAAPEVGDVIV